ncbi:MAG: hypothetical protein COX17_10445 [Deltaproteobacteria bacterium CG23_combo_of_CG06-09_8_20_14_all_60_8]|nr:MAG: hypothetical protein COX17_10445 [Deltaproteobacteria bacterium CG23_combo_of_CG06-09_8_20_14_all_60_8]
MFSIRFLHRHEVKQRRLVSHWHEPADSAFGEIVLGDFKETFISSLSYWRQAQYLAQWRRSLNSLLKSGKPSYLIVSIDQPELNLAMFVWPIFVFSKRLIFQNRLILPEDIKYSVSELEPKIAQFEYQEADEDGNRFSEWEVGREDLAHFLEEQPGVLD